MNNIIECICRNLPYNEVRVTSPTLIKDQEFIVCGFDYIDTNIPIVLTKKPNSDSRFDIPCSLIEKIIIIP